MSLETRDRYVTFDGLDCDANASQLMASLRHHIADPAAAGRWSDYFSAKLIEQQRLGVDDLFFVGSQMNNIYAYLEERNDETALELLYQVEQECC